MKRDIRDLFTDDDTSGRQLPENHRQEFYDKLKASRPRKTSKLNNNYIFKVAAIAVLLMAFTFTMLMTTDEISEEVVVTPMETQINIIEQQYLANIDAEWNNFISVTNDENLIKRYRDKLDDLDHDYQDISIEFKSNNNNIQVIENLVDNLKTRLQLLKDIQEHIKILNQKNEPYETTNI